MKYTLEIDIDLPRERVIELFDSTENLKKWQPGLISFDHISGTPGQSGAKSKLVYEERGRKIEMIETLTVRNLPGEFSATFESTGVMNIQENYFHENGPDKTRWVTVSEFQFSGLYRLMGIFMRGAFPKQTYRYMELFKEFAEGESS